LASFLVFLFLRDNLFRNVFALFPLNFGTYRFEGEIIIVFLVFVMMIVFMPFLISPEEEFLGELRICEIFVVFEGEFNGEII